MTYTVIVKTETATKAEELAYHGQTEVEVEQHRSYVRAHAPQGSTYSVTAHCEN